MIRRSLKKTILALGALAGLLASSANLAAQDLYWTEYGGAAGSAVIKASDIDGSNETIVFEGTDMTGFAVDVVATDTHLYWSGHNGGDVWRANRDGSSAGRIIEPFTGLVSVHNIAVDDAGGKIYIACHTNGIFSANLDGTDLTSIFSVADQNYSGITLKGSSELLWFTTLDNFLYVQDTDGFWFNEARELEGGTATYGLAYDPATDMAYYTVWAGAGAAGALYSYSLTTSESTLLRSDIMAPLGLKLSPARTHLLIAQRGLGLGAYRISDGGYELIVPATGAHFGVAVTAEPELIDPSFPLPPPPPAEDGDAIFIANFDEDEAASPPRLLADGGDWSGLSGPTAGTVAVLEDTDNSFGFGTDNKFLRVESARQLTLTGSFPGKEVVSMSFDYIGRVNEGDGNRWLNVDLRGGSSRAHITSIRIPSLQIRPDDVPSGVNDIPLRFDTIFNNSVATITYDTPDGGTADLASGRASLWVYNYLSKSWDQLYQEYVYVNALAVGQPIDNVVFQFDSNDPLRSFDLDNVYVVMGAYVGAFQREAEVAPLPFGGYVDADFNGIPLGEISRANAGDFVHGNLSEISFHNRYDTDVDGDGSELPPLLIVQDTENKFGRGTENQILRTNKARGWRLIAADNNFNEEVMTLRIDMADLNAADNGRLTSRFYDLSGNVVSRLELMAQGSEGDFSSNPGTFGYGSVRFESVVNNSANPIEYTTPTGGLKSLIAGGTDMWVNGELAFQDSTDLRTATSFGPIMNYRMETFSTNRWDADIDLVQTLPGVQLVAIDGPPLSPYRLQPVWTLAPGDRVYLTDDNRQRGLGYNPVTGNLIVPDRHDTIAILDGATGAHIGTLSNVGISGGTFTLNHVVVAADGAIYGANLTVDTLDTAENRGPLKVYRWANEAAEPVLVYEGDPSRGDAEPFERRFGDTMSIRGSGLDTEILIAPRFGVNPSILTPNGSMETFVDNRLLTDLPTSPGGWLTHGLAFGEGDTFWGKRQPQTGSTTLERGLVELSFDLNGGTGTVLRTFAPSVFPNSIGPIGVDPTRQLLVGVNSYAFVADLPQPVEVMLFDLSTLSEGLVNLPLDVTTFGPQNLNGNGSGQVVFGGDDMVYVLDTNNGIAAFRLVTESLSEGFANWQESNFPGQTDPGIVGPAADPSGDGVVNLLKYALGLDPNESSREGLPTTGVGAFTVADVTADYLTLTFTKPDSVDDVGYSVRVSADLSSWPAEAVLESSTLNGDGTTTYIYRDIEPLGSNDRRFMNLEVMFLQ